MNTDIAAPEARGQNALSTWERAREDIGQAKADNTKRAYSLKLRF